MEAVLAILAYLSLAAFLAISFGGFAGAGGKSKSEDQARYEHFNPRVKPLQEVHRKEPTPLPTKDSALVTLDGPEKLVQSLMERRAYDCFESQSVDEARRIMREHDLQYLLVLDNKRRIVGTVRMSDLGEEDPPQSEG
jgi:CBS domain-containing protein